MPSKLLVMQSLALLLTSLGVSTPVLAYVGPGLGLTAIGSAIALLAAGVLAVVGFLWYPLKRLIGRNRDQEEVDGDLESESDSNE